mgnify:FL=1
MISIIVPIYNTPKDYIQKCISSLLKQTYSSYEILLVDDGSNEDVADYCDELSHKDLRIRVYHQKNRGVSSARNLGLEVAGGGYIAFVDADDWVEPDYIEKLLSAIEMNAEMAICNICYDYGEDSNSDLTGSNLKKVEYNKSEVYKELLYSKEIGGFLCNKLFKKKFITKRLDESLHYSEDYVFVAEYCRQITKAIYLDSKLYHYRQDGNSATKELSYNSRIYTLMESYKNIERIYLEELPTEEVFVQKNTLKIALNLRARYLIGRVNNKEEYLQIIKTIKSRIILVLKSSKITLFTKLNIIGTLLLPRTMLKMKNKVLGRKKKSG